MSVIAISIEPDRLTRIFFDCRRAKTDQDDEARIAREIAWASGGAAISRSREAGVGPRSGPVGEGV